jgi:hypothetical protein
MAAETRDVTPDSSQEIYHQDTKAPRKQKTKIFLTGGKRGNGGGMGPRLLAFSVASVTS